MLGDGCWPWLKSACLRIVFLLVVRTLSPKSQLRAKNLEVDTKSVFFSTRDPRRNTTTTQNVLQVNQFLKQKNTTGYQANGEEGEHRKDGAEEE